ncbi:MAG: hypothetical protein AABO57_21825 [Acidobacteriota bacterium]
MKDSQSRSVSAKTLALVILVAIVAAVAVTLIQQLLVGNASAAVTGGVVGAVVAVMAITIVRKNSR